MNLVVTPKIGSVKLSVDALTTKIKRKEQLFIQRKSAKRFKKKKTTYKPQKTFIGFRRSRPAETLISDSPPEEH